MFVYLKLVVNKIIGCPTFDLNLHASELPGPLGQGNKENSAKALATRKLFVK